MVVSSGAGANARHAIGTGVVGGMLSAAVLGVLMIPVCYVAVRRLMGEKLDAPAPLPGGSALPGPAQRRED
jgi:multidrug efflux pump